MMRHRISQKVSISTKKQKLHTNANMELWYFILIFVFSASMDITNVKYFRFHNNVEPKIWKGPANPSRQLYSLTNIKAKRLVHSVTKSFQRNSLHLILSFHPAKDVNAKNFKTFVFLDRFFFPLVKVFFSQVNLILTVTKFVKRYCEWMFYTQPT